MTPLRCLLWAVGVFAGLIGLCVLIAKFPIIALMIIGAAAILWIAIFAFVITN